RGAGGCQGILLQSLGTLHGYAFDDIATRRIHAVQEGVSSVLPTAGDRRNPASSTFPRGSWSSAAHAGSDRRGKTAAALWAALDEFTLLAGRRGLEPWSSLMQRPLGHTCGVRQDTQRFTC